MSEPAFERYREALRQGHLAALRGDQEAAAAAYAEAATFAPDRPLPQVGLGTSLRELGRHAEALAAFERALELAPLDETALRGRAAACVALGQPAEAATTLTGLAESLEADGRTGQALELAREALALAASPARFRLVARLSAAARSRSAASDSGRIPAEAAEAPPAPPDEASIGIALVAEADALVDAGRTDEARERYLAAARSHRAGIRRLAAIDACYQALAIAPADADLHLVLAELYDEHGWASPAVDKLILLARLLELVGDTESRERLCRLVGARFPSEPRLAEVCG